ncbi:MAG: O-antigen ligase family protein [Bacteroidetes bacterium]|nr:O-antigen ligase family protein [Bacteroidota bacterium]
MNKKAINLFFAGVLLFCFTLPLPVQINNVSLYLMIIGWILSSEAKEKWILLRSRLKGFWIMVLFIWYAISLLYSSDFTEGISKLETKGAMIALPLIIYSMDWSGTRIHFILRSFAISMVGISLVLILIAVYRYANGASSNVFFYHDLTEPFDLHAIYFANYLCVGLLILIFDRSQGSPKLVERFMIILSIVLIVMLTAISVMGFLVCLGFVGSYFYLTRRSSPAVGLAGGLFLFLLLSGLAMALPGSRYKIEQVKGLNYDLGAPDSAWNSITMRLAMWECSLPVVKSHFCFGVGIGDENQVLQESYHLKGFSEGIRCNYNVHNQYLSNLMTLGLPGLILLLAMLIAPAWQALLTKDWLWMSFLSLMTLSFITENFISTQKGVVFFSFFYSLLFIRNGQILGLSNFKD